MKGGGQSVWVCAHTLVNVCVLIISPPLTPHKWFILCVISMEETQTRSGGSSDPVPAPLWARFPGLPACPPACLSIWSSGSSILPPFVCVTCLLINFGSVPTCFLPLNPTHRTCFPSRLPPMPRSYSSSPLGVCPEFFITSHLLPARAKDGCHQRRRARERESSKAREAERMATLPWVRPKKIQQNKNFFISSWFTWKQHF